MVPQAANLCGEFSYSILGVEMKQEEARETKSLASKRQQTRRPILDRDSAPVSCLRTVLVFPLGWLEYPSTEALPPCMEGTPSPGHSCLCSILCFFSLVSLASSVSATHLPNCPDGLAGSSSLPPLPGPIPFPVF